MRAPNTRSFLSQNVFTDMKQPLTFANDIKFNGGNSTNDGYEEYIRLDASTVTIDMSKNVNIGADLIMRKTKVLFK